MKKRILAIIAAAVMCFAITGCGGSSNEDSGSQERATAPEKPAIVGYWKCVDMTMTEGKTKMDKEFLESNLQLKVSDMAYINVFNDGMGEMFLVENTFPIKWEEKMVPIFSLLKE